MQQLNTQQLAQWCPAPEQVFLGFGFEWQPHHSPRLYKLTKLDCRQGLAPPWALRWRAPGLHLQLAKTHRN
ncbi:hypothetical protein HBO23_07315 [Pseudomonas sp. WS 5532]|nr:MULTISPECIES: hypothetical protein [unclassified Pseudomonas]NMX72769.1 hypothetical protein [Pseudomonas sp. WS 5532]QXI56486.1 hypothetical protein HU759_015240 [Pseudomonas sp. OE 28.3]